MPNGWAWFSQEVEESCGDGDLAVLILFELDDAPDELNESNDASDEDEGQNKLDDSGKILPLRNLWIPSPPRKKMITRYKILLIFSM